MADPATIAPFDEHLATVRQARAQSDEIIASLVPAQQNAGKALAIAWEVTFDIMCQLREKPDEKRLTELSGVMYKLAQGQSQLLSVEHKSRDLAAQLVAVSTAAKRVGLPPELLGELEKELQLMG